MASCGTVTVVPAFSESNVSVTGCNLDSTQVEPGESVDFQFDWANENDDAAAITFSVRVNGEEVETTSVNASTGQTGTESVSLPIGDRGEGDYDVSVVVKGASRSDSQLQRAAFSGVLG